MRLVYFDFVRFLVASLRYLCEIVVIIVELVVNVAKFVVNVLSFMICPEKRPKGCHLYHNPL